MINYLIAFLAFVMIPPIMYNLFVYPISVGRLLLYIFILFPLVLIGLDLGLNEQISNWIDKRLTRKYSIIVQVLIIVMGLITGTILGMYCIITQTSTSTQNHIIEIYGVDVDTLSIYMAVIPIAAYVIYYYALYLYNYIVSKKTNNQTITVKQKSFYPSKIS